jgi:hypothetical protein
MARKFYLDTDTQEIWRFPTRSPILSFGFQRGSTEAIELRFVTDGVVVALTSGNVVTLSFKAAPSDGTFLVPAVTATESGTGAATKYTLLPVFSSTPLDTLLGSAMSAQAYMELKWVSGGTTNFAGPYLCRITQNLNRGGEATPGVVTSALAQTLPTITSFTGSDTTDLPYVPTTSLSAGTGVPFFIRLDGQFVPVYLESGAVNGSDPGQVAPLDYHASTNAKHWTRGL